MDASAQRIEGITGELTILPPLRSPLPPSSDELHSRLGGGVESGELTPGKAPALSILCGISHLLQELGRVL